MTVGVPDIFNISSLSSMFNQNKKNEDNKKDYRMLPQFLSFKKYHDVAFKFIPIAAFVFYLFILFMNHYFFLTQDESYWKKEIFTIQDSKYAKPDIAIEDLSNSSIKEENQKSGNSINSVDLYEICKNQLCEISYYGGWPGLPYNNFRIGMTFLVVMVLCIVYARLSQWKLRFQIQQQLQFQQQQQKLDNIEIEIDFQSEQEKQTKNESKSKRKQQKQTCQQQNQNQKITHNQQYMNIQFNVLSVLAYIATLFLIPMAFIPFYESEWHFYSAGLSFFLLSVCQYMDTNLFNYFSQVDVELGILDEKKREFRLVYVFYRVVQFVGVVSFLCWFQWQENGSYYEYLGTMTPFIYFLAFNNTFKKQKYLIQKIKEKYFIK